MTQIVESRPHNRKCHANMHGMASIMRLAFQGDNLSGISDALLKRIEVDATDYAAMMDLSLVLQLNGKPAMATELQKEALRHQQSYCLLSSPAKPSLRLLAIMGPGEVMANTPIDFLVEDTDIALSFLYLGEGLPVPDEIPEHDVAFVAVCESDENQFLLEHLSEIMLHWPRPFINHPARIARLSRDTVSEQLVGAFATVASDAHRISREQAKELGRLRPEPFPLIARPVHSHAGIGLAKLEHRLQAVEYLESQPDEEFFIAPFIDYRSSDGVFRKYRIVVIDGKPFAAHMALSQHWMVHYLNADMLGNEANRNTEARFMQEFDETFAVKHEAALRQIDATFGLDYYSIDCAETPDGKLLVFELDSGAVVHSMDPVELFPYKAPQMHRVFEAFQRMLRQRAFRCG